MEKRFGRAGMVYKWRRQDEGDRDAVQENAVLLLQHGLVYRRFSESLATGDTGWVMECIKYFTIWL